MLIVKKIDVGENLEYTISEMLYCKDRFNGPFAQFKKVEYIFKDHATIVEFKRFFAEDAKYADKTQLQLMVEALSEISLKSNVCLKLWGKEIKISKDSDEFEIQEILVNFILKNADFT